MLIIITYDVNTQNPDGIKRLNKVAKYCQNFGQRVQNSVFECSLNTVQYKIVKNGLLEIIDERKDSIKFYNLGNKYHNKIESFGIKRSYEADGFLDI